MDLPRIFTPPNLPTANLPRVNGDMFGANVFAAAGEAFKQIDDAYTESETRRIQGETAAKIKEAMVLTKADESDPDTYYSTVAGKIEQIKQDAMASASTPRIRGHLSSYLSVASAQAQTEAQITVREKQVERAQGNSVAIMAQASRDMAQATSPEARSQIEAGVVQHLQAMGRAHVYTPAQIQKLGESFLRDSDRERMTQIILNNPEAAEKAFTVENFPYLDNEAILSGRTRAKERINFLESEKKKAEREVLDGINVNMLQRAEAARADLTGLREEVLNDPRMPFETKKFWVDRFNQMIKAGDKAEGDPFRKSDGAAMGRVFQTILEHPEQISASDISGMIGNGLSVADALRATDLLAKRTKVGGGKELPAAMDPLNMAFKSWEKLRDQFSFVSPADPKNMTAEEIANNQNRAVEIWQGVLDTMNANPNANPQDALNTLMKPYYQQAVKGWFEFGSTANKRLDTQFGEAASNVRERGNAINELKRRSLPVTEQNIAKVIERQLGQAKAGINRADQEKARQTAEFQRLQSSGGDIPAVTFNFKDEKGNPRQPTVKEKEAIDKYLKSRQAGSSPAGY
jgi:hypothetical protein